MAVRESIQGPAGRVRRAAIAVVAVSSAALLVAGILVYLALYTPISADGQTRVVEIPKGTSFRVIAASLEKDGVIGNARAFAYAAQFLGKVKAIKAGEYEFNRSMNTMEILDILVSGRVRQHPVTIPEGYNIREIAAVLKEAGLVDEGEFTARATDADFVRSMGLEGRTFEGYLFPDTYILTKGMSSDEIITGMAQRFKTVYFPQLDAMAKAAGMPTAKVVTLASIIEKETGKPDERALISSVFHNRLKKRIKLQSDPTVIYAIEGFDGNLRRRDLLRKNPYNTYVNYGLPPGPIANPGRESLRAAIAPDEGGYLYFVSKNNGTHFFSKTLREHNNAVNVYQKRRPYAKAVKEG
ncbi:MAG: endolytic transglycosylase MltG [Deltaproteobacteria bacterium]|nr:endolytic transglycosylase MltG [Deltaproteobacteria bacterium]